MARPRPPTHEQGQGEQAGEHEQGPLEVGGAVEQVERYVPGGGDGGPGQDALVGVVGAQVAGATDQVGQEKHSQADAEDGQGTKVEPEQFRELPSHRGEAEGPAPVLAK